MAKRKDNCDDETADRDWNLYWDIIYKNITVEDISNYEKKYKESDEELQDLKRAYLGGKGDMDLILELVPFTNTDEEPRLKKLIQGLIDRGEVPAFPAFTHESAQKKANRKRKWEREAREAAALEKERGYMGGTDDDLKKLLLKKQEQRSKEYDSFFEALASKYGGKDTKRRSNPKRNKKQ